MKAVCSSESLNACNTASSADSNSSATSAANSHSRVSPHKDSKKLEPMSSVLLLHNIDFCTERTRRNLCEVICVECLWVMRVLPHTQESILFLATQTFAIGGVLQI